MMVLIDTNVVVSAAFKDRAPEEVLLFIVNHPDFAWVASEEIISEYIHVLRLKPTRAESLSASLHPNRA